MVLDLGRYGSREILNAQIIDFVTKKPIMYMDYANTASNEWSADVTYATGGSGAPRRISWFGNKQSTLTFETQIFTMQHLALLAGRDIESGAAQNIYKREIVTVEDDGSGGKQITLAKPPVNQNTVTVFQFKNGITGAEQQIDSVTTNTVKLATSATVNIGDEVEVFYQWATTTNGAHKLSFTAGDFPKYVQIVGDTTYVDEVAGDIVAAQLIYYKARLQPNFTLSFSPSGDPTSLSLTFDIFPHKVEGEDRLADLIIYEE